MKQLISRVRGFTLVELLAVIAVIVLLLSFVAPAATSALRGVNLTQQGNAFGDAIALARQTAVTKNRQVELRLITLPYMGDDEGNWAFQLWEKDNSGNPPRPLTAFSRFQESVIVDTANTSSPLLEGLTKKQGTFQGINGDRDYYIILFRPNGRIAGRFGDKNYLTLTMRQGNMEDNYYTLQLNPITGGAQIYRP